MWKLLSFLKDRFLSPAGDVKIRYFRKDRAEKMLKLGWDELEAKEGMVLMSKRLNQPTERE